MAAKYLLGIDAGTSMVKAVVFDTGGREIGSGAQKILVDSPSDGYCQQDPEMVWKAVATTIGRAIESAAIHSQEIAVVGPAGQGDGAWLLDEENRPMSAAPLWNDGRAVDIITDWQNAGLLEQLFALNGTQLWPGSAAPLLAWLKNNSQQWRSGGRYTLFCCKDWLKYKLTGIISTDETDGSIPFLHLARRQYDLEIPQLLGLADEELDLARIVPSHEVAGAVTAEAAKATGLAEGTPVVSGMLDVAANAIGAGVVSAGQALSIIGTTSLNMLVLDEPTFEPMGIGATTCHAAPDRWMRILGSMTGTPNLDWYLTAMGADFTKQAEDQQKDLFALLEEAVGMSPVGAKGVVFHPYLFGERVPFVNTNARAGFFGINATTTNNDLLRAIFEGIALSARHCYQTIGKDLANITLVGGGSRSKIWCQTLADVLGCQMTVPEGSQFGALGAAIAGGVGVGLFTSYEDGIAQCVRSETVYQPMMENTRRYDDLYILYTGMAKQMRVFWDNSQQMMKKWDNP